MQYSVLMSVYHRENAEYLKLCLQSLMEQTIIPNEIVLVQDGELTKALYAVISGYKERYPEIFKIVNLEENQGLGNALNEGLKACTNEIVARMDSDDICVTTRFEKQLKFMENTPQIDIVGTWIDEFEETPKVITSRRKVPCSPEVIGEIAKKRNPLNHMTVMFKKEAVMNSGGYKHFLWNEDYYLWVRMLKKGYVFANIPESLVIVRAGKDMFKRRGGIKYFIQELKLQREFLNMQYIKRHEFYRNVVIRLGVRIMPNSIRGLMYQKLLRGKSGD